MEARVGKFKVSYPLDDQYIGPLLQRGHEWDGWMRHDLSRFYKPGTDIIDVGGNIGWNALMFSDYGPVHTFEPLFHEFITKNINQNSLTHPVTVHSYGLSSKECQVPIFLLKKDGVFRNYGGSSVEPNDSHESKGTIVNLKCLDDIYKGPGPSMMKIDVEGHELEVLKGSRNVIERWKPAIWVEIFNFPGPVVDFLQELGYKMIESRYESNYVFF
jgi:FkbM family methyltransferase